MSGFDGFIGSEKLISRLKRDIAAGRLSHALIIEGAPGTGKRTLARLICAAVSCREADRPCMSCINCSKILRDQSPDVIFITPDKDRVQLGVDVIRRLREDAVFAAGDLPAKFYIIPDADAMNVQAQNALLKILEEPPAGVMFLLLAKSAENLLVTIRSRAPTLRLQALTDAEVESAIASDERAAALRASDPHAFAAAVKLARGSIGRALELADPKKAAGCLELYAKAERFMELLAARGSAAGELTFYEYAAKLVTQKQREELSQIYSLLTDAVRDLCALKLASSPELIFWTDRQKAITLSEQFALTQLMRLSEIFAEAVRSTNSNVGISLVQVRTAAAASAAGRKK
ncbi:MAG: hypothetical protein J6C52_08540 [Clostridia bacterium]|nr:hypothetical protein [Clostridia bacterium]